jgi:hypothetical protein
MLAGVTCQPSEHGFQLRDLFAGEPGGQLLIGGVCHRAGPAQDAPRCCRFVTAKVLTAGRAAAQRAGAGLLGPPRTAGGGEAMAPPARHGAKIRRRLLTATAVFAGCAAGQASHRCGVVPSATQAAHPRPAAEAAVLGRCPSHLPPLPPEAAARAGGQARIQALLLYRASGPAVVAGSALAPDAGPRGDAVSPSAAGGCPAHRGRGPVVRADAAQRLAAAGHGLGAPVRHRLLNPVHDRKGRG